MIMCLIGREKRKGGLGQANKKQEVATKSHGRKVHECIAACGKLGRHIKRGV